MIRVNLAKNISVAATQAQVPEGGINISEAGVSDDRRDMLIKLALILILPLAAMIVRIVNNASKSAELNRIDMENGRVMVEIQKFGNTAAIVEEANRERERLAERLEEIRQLARRRLVKIKALDNLQTIMPNNAWLRLVNISDTGVEIEGFTASSEGLAQLMKVLEESIYFTNIRVDSTSRKDTKEGGFNTFKIKCDLGGEA